MTTMFQKGLGLAFLCGGLMALPLSAQAGNASTEIMTAATHAGFAAKSAKLAMVRTHLHHTLNCLVGPGGEGFDKTALNPCKNSGDGAIPDTSDTMKKSQLDGIAKKARDALMVPDLVTAQKDAAAIEAELMKLK